MNLPVYLDNHSSTKCDPLVVGAMLPFFSEMYGNPASASHSFGWQAASAVKIAREKIAALVNSSPSEIIFTSGTTESVNLALKGAATARGAGHIVTTKAEHSAVLESCRRLEKSGFELTYLDVDKYGMVSAEDVERVIRNNTILVSVIHANNEIGTVNDVEQIAEVCERRKVLFHIDAAQSAGKIKIDVTKLKADLISFSAHKMYGPKGIGALYIRKKSPAVNLISVIDGGGQERGLRSGTLNVPGIVGFGLACELSASQMDSENMRISALRDKLLKGILSNLEDVYLNGHPQKRLAGNLHLSFKNANSDALILKMKDIAVSSSSACSSSNGELSHVLKAIGLNEDLIKSSLRFGIGRFNTEEEIDYTINKVVESVRAIRKNHAAV